VPHINHRMLRNYGFRIQLLGFDKCNEFKSGYVLINLWGTVKLSLAFVLLKTKRINVLVFNFDFHRV
jgi:hypothetical protein